MDPTAHSTSGWRFQACSADRRDSQLRWHVSLFKGFSKPLEPGCVIFPCCASSVQAEVLLHFQLELPPQTYGLVQMLPEMEETCPGPRGSTDGLHPCNLLIATQREKRDFTFQQDVSPTSSKCQQVERQPQVEAATQGTHNSITYTSNYPLAGWLINGICYCVRGCLFFYTQVLSADQIHSPTPSTNLQAGASTELAGSSMGAKLSLPLAGQSKS